MKLKFFNLLTLFVLTIGFSHFIKAQTPVELLRAIPNAEEINSGDILKRIAVLDKLVVYKQDYDVTETVLPYNLSPEVYAFVVGKIFEKDLTQIDVKEASRALSKSEFLMKKFALKQFVADLASYIQKFIPGSQTDFQLAGIQFGILATLKALQAKETAPQIALLLQPQLARNLYGEALSTLVELRAREAVPALISQLYDKNNISRYATIAGLIKVDARESAPHVAKFLKDENPNIGYWALDALVKFEVSDKYVSQIWDLYNASDQLQTRTYALAALVAAKDERAVPLAVNVVTDKDGYVRGEMLRRLVEAKAVVIIAPLIETLKDKTVMGGDIGTDSNIRSSIIQGFSNFQAKEAIPVLRGILNERNRFLRTVAAQALGDLEAKDAVDDLMDFFLSGLPNPPDRINNFTFDSATAAVALAKIGDKKTWKSLIDAAENPNYPYRSQIIEELNKHLDRELWRKSNERKVSRQYIVSIKEIAEAYSRETEIPVILLFEPGKDISKTKPLAPPYKDTKGYPWANIGGGISLLEGLRYIPRSISAGTLPENFTFIFDDGRIRILSVENAVEWWRKNILSK